MTNTTDDSTRREWDAPAYETLNAPMNERGNDAVARLELRGDETVLDAGCGTGEVTATLLERLPHGRVIALDGSRQMLDAARDRFANDPRVSFVHADLGEPLPLAEPVDAIVSTSTFHWVPDHEALFRHLAAVVRLGGQLVVDCGGAGNIAAVLEILRELGHAEHPWTYAGVEETEARLRAAGFAPEDVRLVPRVSRFAPDELERFLTSVVLRTYVMELGPETGGQLVRDVASRLPQHEIHWVRLEVVARLSDAGAAG
ncbi:MAG TPA: methyltransferase domain-containing protein [Conexibacter sp.]|jgi:trans-aconitate 2-methyltransferase|nr:methyltransferase domain-containing protein [Conexibacter sp.]